ncbi:CS1 type fimbrial major subunit [Escherichia coli]|nr:CS1 type fimbrial major subunit [Escherichia coli]
MKLKKTIGTIALATLFATMGASAVEKNITVTASVDPSIDLLQSDGSDLPTSVALTYSPAAKNFEPYSLNTVVHTNDSAKGVVVKLSAEPVLTNILDSNDQIPMTVTWGGETLSTADFTFDADTLNFNATGVDGVSSTQQLMIHADTQGIAPQAGNFQGVVSIVLTQST